MIKNQETKRKSSLKDKLEEKNEEDKEIKKIGKSLSDNKKSEIKESKEQRERRVKEKEKISEDAEFILHKGLSDSTDVNLSEITGIEVSRARERAEETIGIPISQEQERRGKRKYYTERQGRQTRTGQQETTQRQGYASANYEPSYGRTNYTDTDGQGRQGQEYDRREISNPFATNETRQGGLERIMPGEIRRDFEMFGIEKRNADELFLNPIGESYTKREEEVRKKRVRGQAHS